MSEPLDDYALAALRDLIDEKAERGGTISAKNAQRLLATLDAVRSSHPDQLEVTLDEERLVLAMRRVADRHPGELVVAYRLNDTTYEDVVRWIAREYAALADTQEESHD